MEKEGNKLLSDREISDFSGKIKIQNSFIHSTGNTAMTKSAMTKGTYTLVVIMSGSMILEKNICLLEW